MSRCYGKKLPQHGWLGKKQYSFFQCFDESGCKFIHFPRPCQIFSANNLQFFFTNPIWGLKWEHIQMKKQLFSNFFLTTQIDCALAFYLCTVIGNHIAKYDFAWWLKSHSEVRRRLGIEQVLCARLALTLHRIMKAIFERLLQNIKKYHTGCCCKVPTTQTA